MNKKPLIIITIIAFLYFIGSIIFFLSKKENSLNKTSITNIQDIYQDWKSFVDNENKIEFKYPENIGADFIHIVDWPPKISILDKNYSCDKTDINNAQGSSLEKTIDNNIYCINLKNEGAAGSTYTEYEYITEKDNKLISIKFTLRYPQCDNYDDPNKTNCKTERQGFDIDKIINQIIDSLKIIS